MGNSIVKSPVLKDEIVEWYAKSQNKWNIMKAYRLPVIEIRGRVALRNQTEEERDMDAEDIQEAHEERLAELKEQYEEELEPIKEDVGLVDKVNKLKQEYLKKVEEEKQNNFIGEDKLIGVITKWPSAMDVSKRGPSVTRERDYSTRTRQGYTSGYARRESYRKWHRDVHEEDVAKGDLEIGEIYYDHNENTIIELKQNNGKR